jgi:cyclopropane fatty-acyl-phospholipid synthase-like methyltransferase
MSYDWEGDRKPFAPSAERNRDPILEILKRHFSSARRVLEIGSGTGQHAVYFASAFPNTVWQTSDVAASLPGIRRWLEEAQLPNLPPPLLLDINGSWPAVAPLERYDAAFTANTLHIVNWDEVQTLFKKLGGVLAKNAMLAVYGPFNYGERFTSDSNRAFDESLRQRLPGSGIRNFEEVDALAGSIGLALVADYSMPANNHMLVWQRTTASE